MRFFTRPRPVAACFGMPSLFAISTSKSSRGVKELRRSAALLAAIKTLDSAGSADPLDSISLLCDARQAGQETGLAVPWVTVAKCSEIRDQHVVYDAHVDLSNALRDKGMSVSPGIRNTCESQGCRAHNPEMA